MKNRKEIRYQEFLGGMIGGIIIILVFGVRYTLEGSLVEWLSAIGTLGAVIISLWLARDNKNYSNITGDCFESVIAYGDYDDYQKFISIEDFEKAEKLLFEGKILFYNPSDFPKTIYNLKMRYEFINQNNESLDTMNELRDDKRNVIDYISLSPRETKVLQVKQVLNKQDVQNEFHYYFFNARKIYIEGQNEMKEAVYINVYINNAPS